MDQFEVGDVVMVSGPFDPKEADDSIRKFEGYLGIVVRAGGYIEIYCPAHPDHRERMGRGDFMVSNCFMDHELTRMTTA